MESAARRCCSASAPAARRGEVARIRRNTARENGSESRAMKLSSVSSSAAAGTGVRIIRYGLGGARFPRFTGRSPPLPYPRKQRVAGMIRTGDEYRAGLCDGREVWIDGERVKDVTIH